MARPGGSEKSSFVVLVVLTGYVAMSRVAEKMLLDIREVSELTGLSVSTLYHWASQGRIPVIRLSRRCIRFRKSDLEEWISLLAEPARDAQEVSRISSIRTLTQVQGEYRKERLDK